MKKKKQTICPRCKKAVPAKTAFCEACGARVTHPPSCSLCGTLLAPGSRFCQSCGTPVPIDTERAGVRGGAGSDPGDHPIGSEPETRSDHDGMEEQKPAEIPAIPPTESPVSRTAEARKSRRNKRSADTIITEPDSPSGQLFSRIPAAIASHKFLAFIIIAAIVITSLAAAGILQLPQISLNSGTVANLAADGSQLTPQLSGASGHALVSPTVTIDSTAISLTPGPTQVPPDSLMVYFQAERDPTTRIVSVSFMGGKGQAGIRDVFVRLTRSDGQVLTGTFKPLESGNGVELQGTEKVDRVEVIVHYHTGDSYTVIDRTFEWKKQL